MSPRVTIDLERISKFCRKWKIAELAMFGSVLRDDFDDESDVDTMVSFLPGAEIGLIAFSKMQLELSDIIGRDVDLVTRSGLKPLIRDTVLAEAEILYAA
jgi:uncharacterized protein